MSFVKPLVRVGLLKSFSGESTLLVPIRDTHTKQAQLSLNYPKPVVAAFVQEEKGSVSWETNQASETVLLPYCSQDN